MAFTKKIKIVKKAMFTDHLEKEQQYLKTGKAAWKKKNEESRIANGCIFRYSGASGGEGQLHEWDRLRPSTKGRNAAQRQCGADR